jgi:Mg/Co/Ni transporter MgtE
MRVLFHCNPATANRLLLKELGSDDPYAQLAAIQIADLSNDPEVLSYLHKQLQSELNSDFDLDKKRQTLATLALIGHRDSLSLLRKLLSKKGLLQSKRQKQFQLDIIQSLNKYPRVAAEKLLQEIADSRNRHQASLAREALQQLTGGSA